MPWITDTIETGLTQNEAVETTTRVLKKLGYTEITVKPREDGTIEVTGDNPEIK